jgi:hypothetical protein
MAAECLWFFEKFAAILALFSLFFRLNSLLGSLSSSLLHGCLHLDLFLPLVGDHLDRSAGCCKEVKNFLVLFALDHLLWHLALDRMWVKHLETLHEAGLILALASITLPPWDLHVKMWLSFSHFRSPHEHFILEVESPLPIRVIKWSETVKCSLIEAWLRGVALAVAALGGGVMAEHLGREQVGGDWKVVTYDARVWVLKQHSYCKN